MQNFQLSILYKVIVKSHKIHGVNIIGMCQGCYEAIQCMLK